MKQDQIQWALPSCPASCHRPHPALFDASMLLFDVLLISASHGNIKIIFCIYLQYFPCCLVNKYNC